jgi:hypothetical protein
VSEADSLRVKASSGVRVFREDVHGFTPMRCPGKCPMIRPVPDRHPPMRTNPPGASPRFKRESRNSKPTWKPQSRGPDHEVKGNAKKERETEADHRVAEPYSGLHSTIKAAPAVAAGVTDHVWSMEEIVQLIDTYFTNKLNAEFEKAFAAKYTALRTNPKSYSPIRRQAELPWHLDINSGGEPNGSEKP